MTARARLADDLQLGLLFGAPVVGVSIADPEPDDETAALAEQEIIERQNMYDGTWTKTQSMGWMFVPLSQYHGGGAAATVP